MSRFTYVTRVVIIALVFTVAWQLLRGDPHYALTQALVAFVLLLSEDGLRLRHRVSQLERRVVELRYHAERVRGRVNEQEKTINEIIDG